MAPLPRRALLTLLHPPLHHQPSPRLLLLSTPSLFRPRPHHPHHNQKRTFLTPLLQTTSTLLTHLAHLPPPPTPWYLILPLTALLLRSTTTLPLTLYARRITTRTLTLQPVLSAWGRVLSLNVLKAHARESGSAMATPLTPGEWEKRTRKLAGRTRRVVLTRFGCQGWKRWLPLGQLPVWVVASLTVRGMTTPLSPAAAAAAAAAAGETPGVGEAAIPDPGYLQTLLDSIPLSHTLSDGGALWFPDLLAPDPLYLLPILLSLSLFANMEFQALQYPPTTPRGRAVRGVLRVLALAVVPVTVQTPTALILYWLSSSLFSLAQNVWLHFYRPLPRVVGACRPRGLLGWEEGEGEGGMPGLGPGVGQIAGKR